MSRSERIADYIERQFVSERGSVDDNIDALFAHNVVYHTPTATLSRSDLIAMATAVRSTSRSTRRVEASQFREAGDTVTWRISATLPGMAIDGGDVEQRTEVRATFNAHDVISEVWVSELGDPDSA